MRYVVDEDREFETADECADYVVNNSTELEELYDQMLDECYGVVKICGCEYDSSYVFNTVDPIAYNCGYNDYVDSLRSDLVYELERMDDDESMNTYGFDIDCYYDEEEEEEDE